MTQVQVSRDEVIKEIKEIVKSFSWHELSFMVLKNFYAFFYLKWS